VRSHSQSKEGFIPNPGLTRGDSGRWEQQWFAAQWSSPSVGGGSAPAAEPYSFGANVDSSQQPVEEISGQA
jgi:hypothetical protein